MMLGADYDARISTDAAIHAFHNAAAQRQSCYARILGGVMLRAFWPGLYGKVGGATFGSFNPVPLEAGSCRAQSLALS